MLAAQIGVTSGTVLITMSLTGLLKRTKNLVLHSKGKLVNYLHVEHHDLVISQM